MSHAVIFDRVERGMQEAIGYHFGYIGPSLGDRMEYRGETLVLTELSWRPTTIEERASGFLLDCETVGFLTWTPLPEPAG